jgi:hypothetical protein
MHHSFAYVKTSPNFIDTIFYQDNQINYEQASATNKPSAKSTTRKPKTILRKKKKEPRPKEHPRKKLLEEAPIHTQRAWLYSAIIPGLGQAYNNSYWEIPVFYGVFAILAGFAIYNHLEYTSTKRDLIEKYKDKDIPSYSNLGNYMEGRNRDRTIFIAGMGLWYLINVFEAYVLGTLRTFDVSDDLSVIIEPTKPTNETTSTNVGLTISLQPKR